MRETLLFLAEYGYIVLFGVVLAEQIGLPIPSTPVFLAMGALAGMGKFSFATAIIVSVIASVLADLVWFQLGRWKGHSILRVLCRISLEPDTCINTTQRWFDRLGGRALLVAKFIPGFSTVAPPIAGASRMGWGSFMLWDSTGALLWCTAFLGVGYAFSAQLEDAFQAAIRLGWWLGAILGAGLAGWIGFKYYQRREFLSRLHTDRIAPEELLHKIENGETPVIIDIRSASEYREEKLKLQGAIWFDLNSIETAEIPPDRDVVIYCS